MPDFAISVQMARAIAFEGATPAFFWGQSYLGTYGCWLTAALFRLFGTSIPLAAMVSLAVWAAGVALATLFALRALGRRAAWWTGLAAAVASPYANHYVAQPYSSYETAAVLGVLALAAAPLVVRLLGRPLDRRSALAWAALGVGLGFGWWTTRLFVPHVVAAAATVACCARWDRLAVRRAAAGAALVAAGMLVGAAPEVAHRAVTPAPAVTTPSLGLASGRTMRANLGAALESLPAYLNGDRRARAPEGATWAHFAVRGLRPDRAPDRRGALVRLHDAAVLALVLGLLALAAATLPRALAARDAARIALCLAPFVHLLLLVLSAQAAGHYWTVRRYWFASLLVVPLLIGNAVAVLDARAALGRVARTVLGAVLLGSAGTQAWMLTLPDQLADHRAVASELDAAGERVAWMSDWNAWLLAALSTTGVEPVTAHYDRRPETAPRLATAERIAVVAAAPDPLPAFVGVGRATFVPRGDAVRRVGHLAWRAYGRATP